MQVFINQIHIYSSHRNLSSGDEEFVLVLFCRKAFFKTKSKSNLKHGDEERHYGMKPNKANFKQREDHRTQNEISHQTMRRQKKKNELRSNR